MQGVKSNDYDNRGDSNFALITGGMSKKPRRKKFQEYEAEEIEHQHNTP